MLARLTSVGFDLGYVRQVLAGGTLVAAQFPADRGGRTPQAPADVGPG